MSPRKPKDEASASAQHGGHRHGIPGGKGASLHVQITPTDLELVREAATAAGHPSIASWVLSVLIPEAVRVLAEKRQETDE